MSLVTGFVVYDLLIWSFIAALSAVVYLSTKRHPASSVAAAAKKQ